jgi:hypothetical protein
MGGIVPQEGSGWAPCSAALEGCCRHFWHVCGSLGGPVMGRTEGQWWAVGWVSDKPVVGQWWVSGGPVVGQWWDSGGLVVGWLGGSVVGRWAGQWWASGGPHIGSVVGRALDQWWAVHWVSGGPHIGWVNGGS